ncbi:GNAT family N-acetyltransferase [Pontibacillus yanchengensis]|uniref:GNAT family N-acetyltransferase n=1 Tax=Pontibacillus yanchengensis TaxID=462910 RepID=A0ACC7VL68_9BACI|nr:GNAT family N-acetyltransferase [Pontibacillus yanchengensis]MYL54919.1 GNAT family N-acetyltransferase [Pontibacillus yanchengensis]
MCNKLNFEINDINKAEIEINIMNSNPSYNLVSKNKSTIKLQDIHSEYEESNKLNTTRLLIKQDDDYIGLVDYCLNNPSDNFPWISLFVIHKEFQGRGYSIEAYKEFEKLIRKKNKEKIRLAVHKENETGVRFWGKFGYTKFKEVLFEGKPHLCLEKELN